MSTELKKGQLFIAQVIAKLKGDDAEALANSIARKSMSAIEGQIAALRSTIVDQEDRVEEANEALENAIYRTTKITDNRLYCQSIVNAQENVDNANETLSLTQKSLAYFQALLAKF